MTAGGPGTQPQRPQGDDAHGLQVQVARELVELSLQRSYCSRQRWAR